MNAIVKQPDRFSETDIDDEIVVMRLDNGEFFSLTGTAAATWRLIDGKRSREELLAALVDRFDGPAADIAADVDDFLASLRDMGLVAVD
jgi:pyrroloquinoline quinone biosynthesis protein D